MVEASTVVRSDSTLARLTPQAPCGPPKDRSKAPRRAHRCLIRELTAYQGHTLCRRAALQRDL